MILLCNFSGLVTFSISAPACKPGHHIRSWEGSISYLKALYILDRAPTCSSLRNSFLFCVFYLSPVSSGSNTIVLPRGKRENQREQASNNIKKGGRRHRSVDERNVKEMKSTRATPHLNRTWGEMSVLRYPGQPKLNWRQLLVESLHYLNPSIPLPSSQDGERQAEGNLYLLFVNMDNQRNLSYESYGLGTVYTCMLTHHTAYTHW